MNGASPTHEFTGDIRKVEHYTCSCKILRDATPKSFVILDGKLSNPCLRGSPHLLPNTELGRGTSTYVCKVISLLCP
jgi:hypothetical protein